MNIQICYQQFKAIIILILGAIICIPLYTNVCARGSKKLLQKYLSTSMFDKQESGNKYLMIVLFVQHREQGYLQGSSLRVVSVCKETVGIENKKSFSVSRASLTPFHKICSSSLMAACMVKISN